MIRWLVFYCVILIGSPAFATSFWLIKDTTVISPNQAPLSNVDVLFSPQGIAKISKKIVREGVKTIDGTGKFLIPGLIDSHVHLGSNGGIREDQISQNRSILKLFEAQEPLSYLYFGFTTLVDLKQSEQFIKNWLNLEVKPNLIYCKGLPFANGYGMAFSPEKIRFKNPYFIYDDQQKNKIPQSVKPAEHSPRALIKKVEKTKAHCIKTFYETGFGGLWDWPTISLRTLKVIKSEANKAGLIHFHHANALQAQEMAVKAGVDVIAHGLWHWEELNGHQQLPVRIRRLLDTIVAKKIAYQPTIQVIKGELALFEPGFLSDPLLRHSLPPGLLKWHQKGNSQWFKNVMEKRIIDNPDIVKKFLGKSPQGKPGETSQAALARIKQVLGYLASKNAKILLASDSPSSPTYTNPPGLNGLLEIYQLKEMGMSLKQVFHAATINNARVFGLDNELAQVKVGFKANLLLLAQNPLNTIKAYDDIEWVIIDGKPIKRQQLSALNEEK